MTAGKSYYIDFRCPKCGHPRLEEKVEGVIWFSEVNSFYQEEDGLTTSEEMGDMEDFHENSEVTAYLCQECGHIIATDAYEALEWLKEHGMIGKNPYETA
jgi:predicted RNA-binding Zn-ribbon protein involved in translation (DUF1610 family)